MKVDVLAAAKAVSVFAVFSEVELYLALSINEIKRFGD
jgi:hypothetical protein